MICTKCWHMWFIEEIPVPNEVECPNCGRILWMNKPHYGYPPKQPYQPEPPLAPDVIKDIIIENCFHLKKSKDLPVLYSYSEKTLRYLKQIGYEVSGKEDHILFMDREADG